MQKYSYWLERIYTRRFQNYPYSVEMFDVLYDESENINARIAAAKMLWCVIPEPKEFDHNLDGIRRFAQTVDKLLCRADWLGNPYPSGIRELRQIFIEANQEHIELSIEEEQARLERAYQHRQYQYDAFFSYR